MEQKELQQLNTLHLKCSAEQFCRVQDETSLLAAIDYAREHELRLNILGGGSNIVLPEYLPGLTVHVDIRGIRMQSPCVIAKAGENWHNLVTSTLRHGFHGIENLSLIPGSVGAAPVQNIGAYGQELSQVLLELRAADTLNCKMRTFSKAECAFGYRTSLFRETPGRYIITSVTLRLKTHFEPNLEYPGIRDAVGHGNPTASQVSAAICRLRQQKLPDPAKSPNAGSFFKNPIISTRQYQELQRLYPVISGNTQPNGMIKLSAAQLIELADLKGSSVGDAMVSNKHSLVLINRGHADNQDILKLADRVQSRVCDHFGIQLAVEPVILVSG